MKTILITALIFFQVIFCYAQIINPAWQFVGPKTSTPTGDLFRSGQIDDITVDPGAGFENHIVVSSFFAGIWEIDLSATTPKWQILPLFDNYLPDGMECNGVGAVTFRNHDELYAGGCYAMFKYDYSAAPPTWTQLGALPQSDILINKIVFMPNDPDHVFLCTSIGLIESTDAGANWSTVSGTTGWIHSMMFIEKTGGGSYFWYIAGQTTSVSALLMESTDDGATFSDMITYSSMSTYTNLVTGYSNSFAGICLGDQSASNGDRDVYISTAVSDNNWGCNGSCYDNDRLIHKLTKNINGSTTLTVTYLLNTGDEYANGPWRLVIGYDGHDPNNEQVITAGVYPHAFNVSTGFTTSIGSIHADYHAIYINTSVNPDQIFLGTDGGFASYTYNGSYIEKIKLWIRYFPDKWFFRSNRI
jgi:hypothetical protein